MSCSVLREHRNIVASSVHVQLSGCLSTCRAIHQSVDLIIAAPLWSDDMLSMVTLETGIADEPKYQYDR